MAGIERNDFMLMRVAIDDVPGAAIAKIGFGHRVLGIRQVRVRPQAAQEFQRPADPILRIAAAEFQGGRQAIDQIDRAGARSCGE